MTMLKSRRLFLITLVLLGLLLSTTVAIAGCGGGTTTTSGATTMGAQSSGSVTGDRALQVLASTPTSGEYANNTITGTVLAQKIADPAEMAKLFILDIRGMADYTAGHIQGATQMDFAQWAAPANLSKLPKDKKIVVVCYTGNTAAQAAAGMRMLGLDAVVLKEGMMGWYQTTDTAPTIATLNAANNPVVMTPAGSSTPAPASTSFDKPSDADYTALAAKANQIMTSMPASGEYIFNTIGAKVLPGKLSGPDKNTLFVLDIRSTDDFNKGHIDGATNIPFAAVAVPDNLKMLPKDKKIIVVCYTGNTAAQATTILRMLDYDAVVVKYGMMGWNGTGKDPYIQEIQNANNPVVTG